MARIQPRTFIIKSGEEITVRSAEEADAAAFLEFGRTILSTTEFSVTELDEFDADMDEEKERKYIAERLEMPGGLVILAEHRSAAGGAELIGELTFKNWHRRRMAHHGHFGISVAEAWRRRGVGRALITTLLDWAAAHPVIEKVCLGVFAPNHRAIALYRALGFVEEGRRRKEFKMGPGRYIDDIQMSLWVKPMEGETAVWRPKNTGHRSDGGAA